MFEDELEGFNFLEHYQTQSFHPSGWDNQQHTQSSVNHFSGRGRRDPNPVSLAGSLNDAPLSTFKHTASDINKNDLDKWLDRSPEISEEKFRAFQKEFNSFVDRRKDFKNYVGKYTPSNILSKLKGINSGIPLKINTLELQIGKTLNLDEEFITNIYEDKHHKYRAIKNHLDRQAKLINYKNRGFKVQPLLDMNRDNIIRWSDGNEEYADDLLNWFNRR